MSNYLYVDNSNVWIEGMHVAAFVHGMAPSVWSAVTNRVVDYNWKIHFGKLHEFAGGCDVGRAVLYASRPPANSSLWSVAKNQGFEVVVHDRNFVNREKKLIPRLSVTSPKTRMSGSSPALMRLRLLPEIVIIFR